jgi:release factor glutamine methyltransferase
MSYPCVTKRKDLRLPHKNIKIPNMTTVGEWLRKTSTRLASISEVPSLEAQVIMAHILQESRTWIIAHQEATIMESKLEKLNYLAHGRLSGEPLPYLLGHWEFYGLDFLIDKNVLIPRPETELLVDQALQYLEQKKDAHVIDVGTGSGCIAISIARHTHIKHMLATDISFSALQIAAKNCTRYNLDGRISLLQCDLLSAVAEQFDLICANLPYIPNHTLNLLSVSEHEPRLALDGGVAGTDPIEKLLQQAQSRIKPGGQILLEIEETTASVCKQLARRYFPKALHQIYPDHSAKPRLMVISNKTA